MDYHQGKARFYFVELDNEYLQEEELSQYFTEYPDWLQMEREVIDEAGGRVLDVGCGAGRHSLYLQDRLPSVLGIDVSPLALEVSKLRGVRQTRLLGIEDIKELPMESVDTIVMMGNNFGLFGNFSQARRLLGDFYKATSPTGKVVATVIDPYKTDNEFYLDYQRFNLLKGRMPGQLRLRIRYHNLKSEWIEYLLVSKEELCNLIDGTGWGINRIITCTEKDSLYGVVLRK